MKIIYLSFSFIFILFTSIYSQPVKIIFDTDMESDVDDVGALAMLHGLADKGDAEILATTVCSFNPWSVATVDAINTYCGRPDIPIGAVKIFGVYRNSKYTKVISEKYDHDMGLGEESPDALYIYRKVLASQPDNSVVIVTVGYLSNLKYLLESTPDDISELNGKDLVAKKVKHLVCMGGRYPCEQNPGRWGNFKPDPLAIQIVAKEWPTKIIFTGGGDFADEIMTGRKTFNYRADSNPISYSYKIFLKSWDRQYHHSADLIAVYVAVRGWEEYFKLIPNGYNHIFEDGTVMWRFQPDNPKHLLIDNLKDGVNAEDVVKVFDDLMVLPIQKHK